MMYSHVYNSDLGLQAKPKKTWANYMYMHIFCIAITSYYHIFVNIYIHTHVHACCIPVHVYIQSWEIYFTITKF